MFLPLSRIGNPWAATYTWMVDGSEIRRSPVEVKVVYPIICKVLAPYQAVVWDFVHQQYEWLIFYGKSAGTGYQLHRSSGIPKTNNLTPKSVLGRFFPCGGGFVIPNRWGIGCPKVVLLLFLGALLVVAVEFSKLVLCSRYTWMILQYWFPREVAENKGLRC